MEDYIPLPPLAIPLILKTKYMDDVTCSFIKTASMIITRGTRSFKKRPSSRPSTKSILIFGKILVLKVS